MVFQYANGIDASVGLRWRARIGDRLDAGTPVAEVFALPEADVHGVLKRLAGALRWCDEERTRPPLLLGRLQTS